MRSARSSGRRPSPRSTGVSSTSSPTPRSRAPKPPGKSPSPIPTILATISGIPKKEPILDEILEVSRHNERVRRIRDIIEMTFDPIAERVEKIVGGDFGRLADSTSADEIGRWSGLINEEARRPLPGSRTRPTSAAR